MSEFEESIVVLESRFENNEKMSVEELYKLGIYYAKINDGPKLKKYFELGLEFKCLKCYYLLGNWFNNRRKPTKMSEYFITAIDLYLNNDFYKYECIDDDENIELLVTKMMELLGNYYDTIDNETEETKTNTIKYYVLAIERGSVNSMFNLGHYYYECRDITNMFKYYFMAIELRDIDTMYELSIYYQKIKDFDNMRKYYLMALEETANPYHKIIILNDGEKYFNLFVLKEELEKIENKPPYLIKKLQNISVVPDIMVYENKKKLFTLLNHVIECGICYETQLNIDLYCGHCCCIDCYPKLYKDPCPYCRI
jgi:hypothetical protein